MKISCIIPTLNRPQALERTLKSLAAQSRPPDEVIVVLQGESPAISEEGEPFRLLVLRQQEPNAQRARNAAALAAEGDLLLFLDDDIEARGDLIKVYLLAFEDPKLGAACGSILEPGQAATSEIPRECSRQPFGWARFPLNYSGNAPTRNFSSCNTCVRAEVHFASGGFDEHFIATIFDDSDWSVRIERELAKRGWEGRHLGGAWLTHFREPSGGRRPGRPSNYVKMDAEGWASRLYFLRKNYGGGAWREILRFMRMDLGAGSLLTRPSEGMRAWREFFRGWHLASVRIAAGPRLMTARSAR